MQKKAPNLSPHILTRDAAKRHASACPSQRAGTLTKVRKGQGLGQRDGEGQGSLQDLMKVLRRARIFPGPLNSSGEEQGHLPGVREGREPSRDLCEGLHPS